MRADGNTVDAVICWKRRSPSAGAQAEDYDGEWTDIETRCSVAIEGHAAAKYVCCTVHRWLSYHFCCSLLLNVLVRVMLL